MKEQTGAYTRIIGKTTFVIGIKKAEKEKGWEFLYLAANIDAVKTGSVIGIKEDRAVNYKASSKGTAHLYDAVCGAVGAMRCNMKVEKSCFEQLEEDARS